jgi:hypothetical protein
VKKHKRYYSRLRKTGAFDVVALSFYREVFCEDCGVVDKVRRPKQVRPAALKHRRLMKLLKEQKRKAKLDKNKRGGKKNCSKKRSKRS